LRFHNPKRFGDIISKEKTASINYFTQILYRGKVVGNAKIEISFVSARNILKKTLLHKEYTFLIKKKYITFNEFDGYFQSEIDKDYYYAYIGSISNEVSSINLKLKEKVKDEFKINSNFAVAVKNNGSWYIVSFIPISTLFSNVPRDLGFLVSYEKDHYIAIIRKGFWILFVLGNIVIASILLLMFYKFKQQERFEELASTDPLTKIKNRRKFDELAEHEFEKSKRYNRPLSFIIFDIDNFKQINDKFGHQIGDKVLKEIATVVKNNIRKTDIFARFGGEEFVILTPETDIKGAKTLAEKIRKIIENHEIEPVGRVTVSIGVTELRTDDKSIDDLYRRADNALYEAKEQGKNIVRVSL
jgi:diguanylate cyclase (GGDEF)-like protein